MNQKNAKALRRNMTDAERRLWYRLRAHRLVGIKFKRQVPVGPYIVDFACLSRMLILEIDGGQHTGSERDVRRDAWLHQKGFHVLRFWNNDVLGNTDAVLETIISCLESPSPGALRAPPSPRRGEGKHHRG